MQRNRLLTAYYGGTILFLLLDFGFGINVRAAFLEPWPAARIAYCAFCIACLGAIMRRPAWSTLVALILGVGIRVMVPSDAIFGENISFLTYQEIINFVLSGYIAHFSWARGINQLISR